MLHIPIGASAVAVYRLWRDLDYANWTMEDQLRESRRGSTQANAIALAGIAARSI